MREAPASRSSTRESIELRCILAPSSSKCRRITSPFRSFCLFCLFFSLLLLPFSLSFQGIPIKKNLCLNCLPPVVVVVVVVVVDVVAAESSILGAWPSILRIPFTSHSPREAFSLGCFRWRIERRSRESRASAPVEDLAGPFSIGRPSFVSSLFHAHSPSRNEINPSVSRDDRLPTTSAATWMAGPIVLRPRSATHRFLRLLTELGSRNPESRNNKQSTTRRFSAEIDAEHRRRSGGVRRALRFFFRPCSFTCMADPT